MQEKVLTTVTGKVVSFPISVRMKAPTYTKLLKRLERGDTNLSRFVEKAVEAALADEPKGAKDV